MIRASVVINTFNRADSLRKTLDSLRYQSFPDFEVIVVNGPSTDETMKVLEPFSEDIHLVQIAERNLSKSRNAGIRAASGDVVAFIDDDAIPEADWLSDLMAAYDSESVGATGGLVFDHTGFRLQYKYSVCNRIGETSYPSSRPHGKLSEPGADPFIYLQGTNICVRRNALIAVGGFDEEIEYMYDETELCLRLIDFGYQVVPLDRGIVHHKYLASFQRNPDRIVFDPYATVKNRYYFSLKHGTATRSVREVLNVLGEYTEDVRRAAAVYVENGFLTEEQQAYYYSRLNAAVEKGLEVGLYSERKNGDFSGPSKHQFRQFPTIQNSDRRLRICLVSLEFPPGDYGGIGRYTYDLAKELARSGHDTHVVTRSPDVNRVDFEEGVWIHRLEPADRYIPLLDEVPLSGNLYHIAAVYSEVNRLNALNPVDIVTAPIWLCEGVLCGLDPKFTTVLTLVTGAKTVAEMLPEFGCSEHAKQLVKLEEQTFRTGPFIHAISEAILKKTTEYYGDSGCSSVVAPLGVRDLRGSVTRKRRSSERVRILFVGRLEVRKGVDILLSAFKQLLDAGLDVELVLAGKDTKNTQTGESYKSAFEKTYQGVPKVRDRVFFTGLVSEEQLNQHYVDSDIVCLPSRFESFGLVLLEGMMFEKPVVAVKAGGMAEIVVHGFNGFLAEPESAESLAGALRTLVDDPQQRAQFGRNSRQSFEEKFSSSVMAKRLEGAYKGFLSAQPTAAAKSARSSVRERFADLIAYSTGKHPEAASEIAAQLLSTAEYPTDRIAAFRKAWSFESEGFVKEIFLLVLGRRADPVGIKHFVGKIRDGASRTDTVVAVAQSEEAVSRGSDLAFMPHLSVFAPNEFGNAASQLLALPPAPFVERASILFVGDRAASIDTEIRSLQSAASPLIYILELQKRSDQRCRRNLTSWIPAVSRQHTAMFAESLVWALERDPDDFIELVFNLLLGRSCDEGGRLHYASQLASGTSALHILCSIALSEEAAQKQTSLTWAPLLLQLRTQPVLMLLHSDLKAAAETLVIHAYLFLFGRTPDAAGLASQLSYLQSGGDRLNLLHRLAFSEECVQSHGSRRWLPNLRSIDLMSWQKVLDELWLQSDELFIKHSYLFLLGEEVTPDLMKRILGRLAAGYSRLNVFESIASSAPASFGNGEAEFQHLLELAAKSAAAFEKKPVWNRALNALRSKRHSHSPDPSTQGSMRFLQLDQMLVSLSHLREDSKAGQVALKNLLAGQHSVTSEVHAEVVRARQANEAQASLNREIVHDIRTLASNVQRLPISVREEVCSLHGLNASLATREDFNVLASSLLEKLQALEFTFGSGRLSLEEAIKADGNSSRAVVGNVENTMASLLQRLIANNEERAAAVHELSGSKAALLQLDQWLRQSLDRRMEKIQENDAQHLLNYTTLDRQALANTRNLEEVRQSIGNLIAQVDVLATKLGMLALDVREKVPEAYQETPVEPVIVNPRRYKEKLELLGGKILLNLGSGEKPDNARINVDLRELPGVEILADSRRLPFPQGSIHEISSSHLVEHFRQHTFETVILPYWKSLLVPGGVLRIVCPNWEEMLRRLTDRTMSYDEFKLVTFGAQDYLGDDHFSMYTPASLSLLLEGAGLNRITIVEVARQNGLCPEMELVAFAPGIQAGHSDLPVRPGTGKHVPSAKGSHAQ